MTDPHDHALSHSHGQGSSLDPKGVAILKRGLSQLLTLTDGLTFKALPSEKYPLPLTRLAFADLADPGSIRREVEQGIQSDPLTVLIEALALLELYESNQPDAARYALDDMPFIHTCFASKRCNGWISIVGDADRSSVESAVNARWQFKFTSGPARQTGVYYLLNMLARYGYVYGRIPSGDPHSMSHFVEDHCPGLIVCRAPMTDLELTLSLAAMKMGVPAVVPSGYPFPLGRMLKADTLDDVAEAVVGFSNIRRLLRTPEIHQLPEYASEENLDHEFQPAATWGATPESFYLLRKGPVAESGVFITGRAPEAHAAPVPLGVLVTVDAEPMDSFDREHIEESVASSPSLIRGVKASLDDGRLLISLADDVRAGARMIGEVILASLRREFPRLSKVRVELIFDASTLAAMLPSVQKERLLRAREIESATEESVTEFLACVGCSPFAPDHVCILTPERPPQCGRSYGRIKAGALYGYDDMTNIHHSALHRDMNSFMTAAKGACLDPLRGEWQGINDRAAQLTRGRTRRIQLHCLDECPTTGCGCFNLIMFKTALPRPGVGIMESGYAGKAPDGRSWKDLHYTLAGKQAPGMAGASAPYLFSKKFLLAHGGWASVVWVSPRIADIMGAKLPPGIAVG